MKRILLLSLLFFLTINTSIGQKGKFKSLFIYNFTKYIKWPDSYNTGKFVIGVFGDSDIIESLNAMANAKKMTGNGAIFVVKLYKTIDEIDDCNILYISENSVTQLMQIDRHLASKPVLIVTAAPGMASQGSIINFVEEEGKIKFELNLTKATSHGLIVSKSLASLAIVI